jgi:hypothetical protein
VILPGLTRLVDCSRLGESALPDGGFNRPVMGVVNNTQVPLQQPAGIRGKTARKSTTEFTTYPYVSRVYVARYARHVRSPRTLTTYAFRKETVNDAALGT